MSDQVRYGIIGAGAVADYHHVPGIRIDPRATLSWVCDPNAAMLEQRKSDWSDFDFKTTADFNELVQADDVDAVIIATPNFVHREQAIACAENGKHIMAEKPLGVDYQEVIDMVQAVEKAGVKHMTAFTYRFAPSMRYLRHLLKSGKLGTPRHFRSQRFLDWPETSWGWRQYKDKAGAGDLFDMTIHRIDFAMDLMGELDTICGSVAQFCPRTETADGQTCEPSEVDDWSALLGRFNTEGEPQATGVWEGSTVMKGYHYDGFGHEWAEVNGTEGSAVYKLTEPNTILLGSNGKTMEKVDVPAEFLSPAGSPRDPSEGVPSTVFRYDLVYELTSAIVEDRPAIPSFVDGAKAQAVADAVLQSSESGGWVKMQDWFNRLSGPTGSSASDNDVNRRVW